MTFSLDSRSDRRGEHPIRLYARTCDGHRFQSTVGYSIAPEKWDSDRQRASVAEASDSATNGKGILFSTINERIEAISKAFSALLSKPGAATKSALASALDQITSKGLGGAIPSHKENTSGTESPIADDLEIIREFLSNFHDFSSKDRRKGFVNVYRPEWHERQVVFFIHPPKCKHRLVRSGAIMMKDDGIVLFQSSVYREWRTDYVYCGKTYELSNFSNKEYIADLVASIKKYQIEEDSYMPDDSAKTEFFSSFVIPAGKKGVGKGAFEGHTELKAVSIPDGIVRIGEYAFAGCTGLTEILLPESVTEIGDCAFEGCVGLKKAYIPNVTKMGAFVFKGCSNLSEIRSLFTNITLK